MHRAGAEDYLPKPFNSVLLRARIGASLERKRLHDQQVEHLAEIERQRRRADELLDAILPAPAVRELKARNRIAPHGDPVMACLRAGFALSEAAQATPATWRVRIGVHIGPVVAGVVGSKKFTFDLWGDTVNLAQRLASFGREPAVHVSVEAWHGVARRARGTRLGPVRLKGKGDMEVIRCEALAV